MDYKEQLKSILAGGPVLKWALLRRHRANFRIAYRHLQAAGEIVESGTGAMGNPVYVGLTGAIFPAPKKKLIHIRKADIKLMRRAGHTEAEARQLLEPWVNNLPAYCRVLANADEDAVRLANDRDAKKWEERVTT
jgi:hypothetical protein